MAFHSVKNGSQRGLGASLHRNHDVNGSMSNGCASSMSRVGEPTATFRCFSCADEMATLPGKWSQELLDSLDSLSKFPNPSWRNSMEDAHQAIPHLDGDPSMSFFAVYDGHGGRATVDYVSSRLDESLAAELRVDDDSSIEERIIRAYTITDVGSRETAAITSGATAVTCLIKAEHGEVTLYAANVGDSRAVLCRGGKPYRLTYDHKAEDKAEQERVEAAGGFVMRNRVLGILAVSRSFGNQGMKEFVTAEPYVSETSVDFKCEFVILACDGLWDVLSDEEAISFVKEAVVNAPEEDVARVLVDEALRRGSTDNVTVVIVFF